jgi:hypothetical protein
MGIAAQLREPTHSREGVAEISEEVIDRSSIPHNRLWLKSRGEDLDVVIQSLFDFENPARHPSWHGRFHGLVSLGK